LYYQYSHHYHCVLLLSVLLLLYLSIVIFIILYSCILFFYSEIFYKVNLKSKLAASIQMIKRHVQLNSHQINNNTVEQTHTMLYSCKSICL